MVAVANPLNGLGQSRELFSGNLWFRFESASRFNEIG